MCKDAIRIREKAQSIIDGRFKTHPNIEEYGTHALCLWDHLEEPAKAIVKDLVAMGRSPDSQSDYCN